MADASFQTNVSTFQVPNPIADRGGVVGVGLKNQAEEASNAVMLYVHM